MTTPESLKDIKTLEALIIKMKTGTFSSNEILRSVHGAIRVSNALNVLEEEGFKFAPNCDDEAPKPFSKYPDGVEKVDKLAQEELQARIQKGKDCNGFGKILRIKATRTVLGLDLVSAKLWIEKHFMNNGLGAPIPLT